jgi:CBS domain-containing protein
MTTDMIVVTPYDTGDVALRRMGDRRVSHLPVVDPYDATKLMGWISKGDLVFAYEDYHRQMEAPFSKEGPDTEPILAEEGGEEVTEPPVPLLHRILRLGRARKKGPSLPSAGLGPDEEAVIELEGAPESGEQEEEPVEVEPTEPVDEGPTKPSRL